MTEIELNREDLWLAAMLHTDPGYKEEEFLITLR